MGWELTGMEASVLNGLYGTKTRMGPKTCKQSPGAGGGDSRSGLNLLSPNCADS